MDFLLSIPLIVTVLALVIGTTLVILEMFLPGVGLPGITGSLLIILGLIALTARIGTFIILVVLLLATVLILALVVLNKSAKTGKNPMILTAAFKKEAGFSANKPLENYVGKSGIALSELRPAGFALIEGARLDVVTQGEFIEKDTSLMVIAVEGRRMVVKKTEN